MHLVLLLGTSNREVAHRDRAGPRLHEGDGMKGRRIEERTGGGRGGVGGGGHG